MLVASWIAFCPSLYRDLFFNDGYLLEVWDGQMKLLSKYSTLISYLYFEKRLKYTKLYNNLLWQMFYIVT